MTTILCVDDDPALVLLMEDMLQRLEYETIGVHTVDAALNVLGRGGVDLIISDYRMPSATGLEFLAEVKQRGLDVPLIMVTGYASIEHGVVSMKAGAIDYLTKPVGRQELELAVGQALEFARLKSENAKLREEVNLVRSSRELIGDSAALARIIETAEIVAPTRACVLIQGESGTGKELIARRIHNSSGRSEGPFISINCAALPESLVESVLFGHEKGAFTGAVKQVKGAFERANGGTLLLDEISEMRLDLQAKLLRVLQEYEFERVGGTQVVKVDVRVLATSNRDLSGEVEKSNFREDLFYRLAVVPILVPPLRERLEDLPMLVQHFTQRTMQDVGRHISGIMPETIDMLLEYSWPGNVRELAHAVERAVILSTGEVLAPDAFDRERFGLAPRGRDGLEAGSTAGSDGGLDTFDLGEAEEVLIQRALAATKNNRTHAARLLGISIRTLRNKLNNPAKPTRAAPTPQNRFSPGKNIRV